jgi:calcineurin-like phosphoesterase family protein
MKIFLTSDTFFGRQLAAIERGFSNSEEMDNHIIDSWNSRVGKNDIVYHLGNFGWDPISTESAMIHLQGSIKFIPATYDTHIPEMSLFRAGRHQILLHSISTLPDEKLILSHWPLLDWHGKTSGVIHAHGGNIKTDIEKGYRFNVNIENWNYAPIELEFLRELIEIKETGDMD